MPAFCKNRRRAGRRQSSGRSSCNRATALGETCRPVCVGMTWRRLITARTMRLWRPRLEEVNRDVRRFEVTVPGGVERVRPRARTLHKTGNWLVITDCSNAFNAVKRRRCMRRWPTACQRPRR